ncbi:RND multidrug efflux transporter [Cytobacillus firmus]|uniref:RND multidrug efflux transporter n=1 Tax=Cytobacillus firmus TaxID=1399 RepID=A0A800MV08_CYTFI|nr:RND multidrug efflux transporter [Cytobacillus firmus]
MTLGGMAVASLTLTTVVVFLPIGFVGGITGKFFLPFALTIVFSLLASLQVSITIVPILAKFSFKKVPAEEKEGALQRFYGRLIEKSLNHKLVILFISFVLLVGSLAVVPSLGFTFIPNEQSKTLTASIELPSSASLEKTNTISLKVEEMLDEQKEAADVTAAIRARDFATGQVKGNDVQAVSSEVKAGVEKLDLPDGVSLTSGGGNDETVEIFQSLGISILCAIGLVYLTMLITGHWRFNIIHTADINYCSCCV